MSCEQIANPVEVKGFLSYLQLRSRSSGYLSMRCFREVRSLVDKSNAHALKSCSRTTVPTALSLSIHVPDVITSAVVHDAVNAVRACAVW